MASVPMKIFPHLTFLEELVKFVFSVCFAISCINVQHKNLPFPSTLTSKVH
jgi:hypothetical protein